MMLLSDGPTGTQGCHCDGERKPRARVPVHGAPPVVAATDTTSYASAPLNARTFGLTLNQFYRAMPCPELVGSADRCMMRLETGLAMCKVRSGKPVAHPTAG